MLITDVYEYSHDTGEFKYKIKYSKFNRGDVAGSKHNRGYRVIRFRGKAILAHHAAWFFAYGYWPVEIDHRDNDKTNNAISNLRLCSRSQNQCNMPIRSNNTSGFKGVSWSKQKNKWRAKCILNGVEYNGGFFDDIESANNAAIDIRRKLHGEWANNG